LPRSMARQPRATPWTYPLLRGATALATFLFAVVLGVDLFARRAPLPTAAPAALPSTVVAMEHDVTSATSGAAPAPTQRVETLAATSAPQMAAPAAPMPTAVARQALATPASESAPQALGAASAPITATPAAKAAQPVPPAEPPTEQPLMDAGLGGGGQSPGAPPPALANEATLVTGTHGFAAATAQPTLAPTAIAQATPGPTLVARASEPQPLTAPLREGAYSTPPPAVNTLRILEGTLAVLALALGVAAWVARRRSR